MNNDRAMGFGIGLLAGAAIGGVLALLYAPHSGKETREMIKQRANTARDSVIDYVEEVKESAGSAVERVREGASEANRKGHAAIEALKS
jgi:gas vesicle protein